MARLRKFFIKMKGTTMTATTAQEHLDILKSKLNDFETQLTALHKDILEKRTEAGVALFEGKDTSRLEDEISKLESKSKTIEFAKATAQTKLSKANENLKTAKRTDATERVKEIRKEVDQAANDLEEILKSALSPAQVLGGLLAEAWKINTTVNVPLSPLGSWVNYSNPYDKGTHVDSMLDELLKHLSQYKPKNDA